VPTVPRSIGLYQLASRLEAAAAALRLPADAWGTLAGILLPELYGEPPPPRRATAAATGTRSKLRTMARRVARSEAPTRAGDCEACGVAPAAGHRRRADAGRPARLGGGGEGATVF
jgi:hypothetical protein